MKRTVFILALVISGLFTLWYTLNISFEKKIPVEIPILTAGTYLKQSKAIIDFSLMDTEQKTFTNSSLLGHWTLMFFGYAHCPDTCPKTLATISELWKILPPFPEKTPLRLAFVSLDPEQDSPKEIRQFLDRFDLSFIGLTGKESMIQALSHDCGIYYWEDPNTKATQQKIIDHSATLLLINPQGKIQALFTPPYQKEAIKKDLSTLLSLDNKSY